MKIEIVTPYQHIVSDEAEEVYAMGPKGEFGILPGHAHYITTLSTGRLLYRKQGKTHRYVVEGGFLEVLQDKVSVLADHVDKPENIDVAKTKTELEKIEKRLSQESLPPEEFQQLLQFRNKEQARLQVASE